MNEQVIRIPVTASLLPVRKPVSIIATLYRPAGSGPFPLAVINHGSNVNSVERLNPKRFRFFPQSRAFVKRGFAVVVPTRRGYGDSDGPLVESYQTGEAVNFYRLGLETALDIHAAISFMRQESWVDSSRVIVIGHSAGGYGCLALGSQTVDGLKGLINFGGIRGSRANDNRAFGSVAAAVGKYGETATVPSLWIYSENDSLVSPFRAKVLFDAYRRVSDNAEFVTLPPFGRDGHYLFTEEAAHSLWAGPVARFLDAVVAPFHGSTG